MMIGRTYVSSVVPSFVVLLYVRRGKENDLCKYDRKK